MFCLVSDAYSFMTQNQEVVVLEGDRAVIKCEVANLGEFVWFIILV